MSVAIPVGRVPKYVIASSLKNLRRDMFKVQLILGYGVQYFDIQKDGDKWVAFYYDAEDIGFGNPKIDQEDESDAE